MFYFDILENKKILRSDFLKKETGVNAFFTTRYDNLEIHNKINSLPYGFSIAERNIFPLQTHSANVEVVDKRKEYPNTDGLILAENDIAISLRFADCTPLIFYDPLNHIGAISHAGWRGTAAKIGVKTVKKMVLQFNSKPENIIAVIGPAISLCCYEVSTEVKDQLLSTVKNSANLYKGNNVDLKGINARQLEEFGIKKIDICSYCTSCNNNLFYSYRKENGTTKRHFAILSLSAKN